MQMKNIETMSPRIYVSFYFSLMIHLSLILLFFFPFSHSLELFCGIDEVMIIPEEKNSWETMLSIDFSLEDGDSKNEDKGDAGSIVSNQKPKDNESSDEKEGTNSDFSTESLEKKGWKDLVQRLKDTKGLRANFKEDFNNVIKDGTVADSYIHRERFYEDIIVKEVYPTVHSIEKPFREDIKNAPEDLSKHEERNDIIDKFRNEIVDEPDTIITSINKKSDKVTKSPLKMSEQERNKYFDNSLTLPKEEQLSDFIERYLGYDPDNGDLPLMFRELYYKNLQRLAYTFSSDSSYFSIDYLQENLNKEDYLKNAMNLVSELKGTKTATEILFTLENIYEIQGNALQHFFISQENLKNLTPEQKKLIRFETLRQFVNRYAPVIKDKKFNNHQDALALYFKKKLEIMDYILTTTPNHYRKSDALFEKGRIYWDLGMRTNNIKERKEAVKVWSQIDVTPNTGDFLNKDFFAQISPFIQEWKVSNSAQSQLQIDSLLAGRLIPSLMDKKKREEQLLWKKKN